MSVIEVHTKVESVNLHLPQIRPFIGRQVRILVEEDTLPVAEAFRRHKIEELLGHINRSVDSSTIDELRSISRT